MLSYRIPSALSLSHCWVSTSTGLAAWAAELCAKAAGISPLAIGLPIRGEWKIVFFFFLFYFILFLSLWQLAVYASLMPSSWDVERPLWLLLLLFLLCVYSQYVCSLYAAPFEQLFDYFHSICSFWVCRSQQVASTLVALAIFKKYKQRSKK